MRQYIFAIFAIMLTAKAKSENQIKSCDAVFAAKSSHGSIVIERAGKVVGAAKIDHEVEGGVFSMDDSLLIVYGFPKDLNIESPQGTVLSFLTIPRATLVGRKEYGSRVYDVSFSDNQRVAVVDSRYGIDVIDLIKGDSKFYDPIYIPDFATQRCGAK
ncbi:hypothetical protein QZM52_00015 [Burkholderia metallica]|uniref:Uncharacterized protein n=1 Tax=Burkholderia metallica TaxID=488729 RepID=A0ABT8P3M1_9BURK|nr:hypothetical protein [Burkholderia metallica]MDN7929662.1 hypothetical protein [Burkholderia metallica]